MKFVLTCLFVVLAGMVTDGCSHQASRYSIPKNSEVQWDGTFIGLKPSMANSEEIEQQIRENSSEVKKSLMMALADHERYISAHVLLTKFYGSSSNIDAGQWNGLHVNLKASGDVEYQESDQEALIRQWNNFFALKSR